MTIVSHYTAIKVQNILKVKTTCFKVTVKTQLLQCFDGNFKTFVLEFKHNSLSIKILCSYRAILDVIEITNTMHKFAPLLYSYMLAPTCFGSSLPSSGIFWIRLRYVKIQIDMVVYYIMCLSGLCVGVSWFSLHQETNRLLSRFMGRCLKLPSVCVAGLNTPWALRLNIFKCFPNCFLLVILITYR
jgi:hypothetical protein